MPTYCFKNPKTKRIVERVFAIDEIPDSITLEDGTVCERSLEADIAGQGLQSSRAWPIKSRAMAVHPSQIKEYSEYAKSRGVPTEFDREGHPIFTGSRHRKSYCEAVGATDLDGGYGDPNCS